VTPGGSPTSESETESTPDTRTARKQRRTRAGLLEAGFVVMRDVGVDDATISAITERADVGFGTFYNYFASKDALAAEVLDCVIDNLGRRNDSVTVQLGETDPVRIVANSVRLVARAMLTEPMWRWWVAHPGLVVDRMREGLRPYGLRDFRRVAAEGHFELIGSDVELAWSHHTWLLAGGVRDVLDGVHDPATESRIAEAVLRVLGVDRAAASAATTTELPDSPDVPIDFEFTSGS
jgi:AcrR family transcriptional regulator